jgi:hypothetical protein
VQGGTSRAIYAEFVDSLQAGGDPSSGGAPHLVVIYRQEAARSIGVIHQGIRYFGGLSAQDAVDYEMFEWRGVSMISKCKAEAVK